MQLSQTEFKLILRNDLMSFIERSFGELNPQTVFIASPHIEVMASRLEACRRGTTKRLIVNLPPRSLKSHHCQCGLRSLAARPPSSVADHRRELRAGPSR